ncbi:galactose oxidase early set domain-containing protein [Spirilliplanes yamanashiensis]|uniref:Galactose oxidase n=1 Tax=Spirilliplanes yamanashiensis TaxID=42233 RepID=A0A8J3Y9G1_9ACTN|nr:galactose oxidase early set domain-containing protein [Spirilliplanes yamanashiensis]MDP9817636.1 hypothetical protein [Spirilliplanes yamanashiensis]GIJ04446.1 hypothetical protein Sya03_37980 [Spirilliplanes yamanashiensis]
MSRPGRWALGSPARPPRPRGHRRPGRARRRLALALAFLVVVPLGLLGQQAAFAAGNLLDNPGLEILDGDLPRCWAARGWGDNTGSTEVVGDAYTGRHAVRVTLTARTDGDRKLIAVENADCAPAVTPGRQYDLSVRYRSSTPDAAVTVFRHDTATGWQYWTDLMTVPVSGDWAALEVRTPEVPPGTDRISWGVSVYGVGSVTTDDYAMVDATPEEPEPVCAAGAACVAGSWEVLPYPSPVRGVHSVLLHNGKVLLIAGSGNSPEMFEAGDFRSTVFDPVAGTFTDVPTPEDLFCAGHVQLADGRVLVVSGNKGYPDPQQGADYQGLKASYIFDPATNRYTPTNDPQDGHWYPSATILGNGDVISLGGLGEDSRGTVIAEYFDAAQERWLSRAETKQTWSFWGLYPAMILLQDGRLFYTGSHTFGDNLPGGGAKLYDYETQTIVDVPGLQDKNQRDQSASVLLPPAQDQRVLTMGGGNNQNAIPANRLTDLIDLKAPQPRYTPGPLLPQGTRTGGVPQTGAEGKMYVSAVILPDGKVFETGGAVFNRAEPVFEASMFDPATDTYQAGMATDPVPRGYHSSSILLPDGRVLSVGDNPGNGSFELRLSLYSPPYLHRGARPRITGVAAQQWAWGAPQRVTVDRPVARAQLIRPAAVTHSSDPNQRSVDLPLTVVDDTTVDLHLTANPNIAPPGWYMLTVTDAAGVPSVARWVQVGAVTPRAAPRVHDFAATPGARAAARVPVPKGAAVAGGFDGCDRDYGDPGQCVPRRLPAEVTDACAWLRERDYLPLTVRGRDALGLDRDRDGRACARGGPRRR